MAGDFVLVGRLWCRETAELRIVMPRKSKAQPEGSPSKTNEQLQQVAAANDAAMEIFAQSCQACASGFASLNGELMGFVSNRFNRDVELGRALSGCANWADALDLQQNWAQQATREYLAEASRITQLASKLVAESWEPVYQRTNMMLTGIAKPAE